MYYAKALMPATIKDIARIAGVTHSTVSRCLNNKPGVSESMRMEIKRIAEELDFEFNANARSLLTSKTGTIGIILNEEQGTHSLHIFTNSFLGYIRRKLEEEDLDTIITFSKNSFTGENNIIRLVRRRKVDGLILLTPRVGKETLRFLKVNRVPHIFSHQIPPDFPGNAGAVYCDHREGGYLATRHLLQRGCRSILCLKRPEADEEFSQRTLGYEDALREAAIPLKKDLVLSREELDATAFDFSGIDGIFAHTDLLALGLMKELKRKNIHIPRDIALVGYDDIELCRLVDPELTSVRQPSKAISIRTCEKLIQQMNREDPKEEGPEILSPRLIPRGSS